MMILMEHSDHVKNLSAEIVPALGGHLDIDSDGKITKKEFIRRGLVGSFGADDASTPENCIVESGSVSLFIDRV